MNNYLKYGLLTIAGMGTLLSHEEVLAGAKAALPGLKRLLQEFVRMV